MNKASIIKRLKAVENINSSGVNIVIWGGLPPIYVQISTGTGLDCISGIKQFESMEDIVRFLSANYSGVDPIILTCGENISSADFYSFGM